MSLNLVSCPDGRRDESAGAGRSDVQCSPRLGPVCATLSVLEMGDGSWRSDSGALVASSGSDIFVDSVFNWGRGVDVVLI